MQVDNLNFKTCCAKASRASRSVESPLPSHPFAQVPAKEVILQARARSSEKPAVRQLGEVPLSHSANEFHRVLQQHGCSIPVPLEYVDLPSQKDVPFIRLSSWVSYLGRSQRLHYLTGTADAKLRKALCLEFWRRYERIRPGHPIFKLAREGGVRLETAIPVLHHGDEGRSYRKTPVMVVSTHGMLGRGCRQAKLQAGLPIKETAMDMNFVGSTVTTHFIFAALPASLYKTHPEALDKMLSIYAEDARELALSGIDVLENGQREHISLWNIGVKGDLPYLSKAGHMSRTFSVVPRQSASKKFCNGICWACLAGKEGLRESYPFEDLSEHPKWLATVGKDPGLDLEGPLLAIPHEDATLLFRPDLWHSMHLGAGKTFIASSIVVVVEALGGPVEATLEDLSRDFKQFCKHRKLYAYISSISRDLLAWQTAAELPTGHWHKGFVTTRLLCWLEDFLPRRFPNMDDPLLLEIASLSIIGASILLL